MPQCIRGFPPRSEPLAKKGRPPLPPDPDPESWPAPVEYNDDLSRPASTSPIGEKERHAALLRNTPAVPEVGPAAPLRDEPDLSGLPSPEGAGYPHTLRTERPDA